MKKNVILHNREFIRCEFLFLSLFGRESKKMVELGWISFGRK